MNTSPTTEERIWAVLAHLSSLAFGMGMLLPVIGWSEQRRKSRYASFQCLQALGYQSLGYTVWFLSYLVAFILIIIFIIILSFQAEKNGQAFEPFAGQTATFILLTVFGFLALYLLLPVLAAVACALGKDFRYPIMGNRLATYLGYPQTDDESPLLIEDHEDRWVAAMGHFSVIILLWGMLAPITAWIVQGKRSIFLKFQSIQTSVYQALVNIMYWGALFFYMFGFFALFGVIGISGNTNPSSSAGMFGLVIFAIFSLIALVVFLAIPLFHILGQWAGYRVLKGDDYRYPIVGRLVERWMAKQTPLAADGGLNTEGKIS
jgi:uncharacterized Tic20 family protein